MAHRTSFDKIMTQCRPLPASPHDIPPRTRPRKRKQPAPSHSGPAVSEPLLEPSLDDVLLSAANARIRGSAGAPKRGRRGGQGRGRGRGRAGRSSSDADSPPGQQPGASGPGLALLAASARLTAGGVQAPALQAPKSPPFWHLSPRSQLPPASSSHPQPAAALPAVAQRAPGAHTPATAAAGLVANGPKAEAMQHALIPGADQHGFPRPKVLVPINEPKLPDFGQPGSPQHNRTGTQQHQAVHIDQRGDALQQQQQQLSVAATAVDKGVETSTEHPHCRKSLDFPSTAHEPASQAAAGLQNTSRAPATSDAQPLPTLESNPGGVHTAQTPGDNLLSVIAGRRRSTLCSLCS